MDELYFEALKSLLVIMLMLVARYVIPYIKTKICGSDYAWIYEWTVTAVKAAEQTIRDSGMGTAKKNQVKEFISALSKEKNLHLTDAQIENLIESAVYAMKQGENK